MSETAPAETAAPAPVEKSPAKKKSTKKSASGGAAKRKATGPPVSELITKAVAASKERNGLSLAALKKTLAAGGYDVEKNNSRIKLGLKSLVSKGTLVQTKGTGASGSFKLNRKAPTGETKPKAKKAGAAKAKKPAGATPKKPKKAAGAKKAVKKTPKKAKKPAAAGVKKVAKSPKKTKAAAKPKKAVKSPAKPKAVKPKAAKPKAAKPKAAKPKAAKAKKAAPKKKHFGSWVLVYKELFKVKKPASRSDRSTVSVQMQLVELLVVADGQLQVTRDDTRLFVVAGRVARQLQDLCRQVLQHRRQVHRCAGPDTLSVVALAEQAVHSSHGKLEPGARRPGLGLGANFASLLATSRHIAVF
eukprot:bmy_11213T0